MTPSRRSPLGTGLSSILGKNAGEIPDIIRVIALDILEPSRLQPRSVIKETELGELVSSIRSQGILQPLLVRPHPDHLERYEIIAGERRWRAAQLAGLHNVPVFIKSLTDTEALAAALIENLQRSNLNVLEEADGFRRLVDEFHLTHEQVAQIIGKSRSHVANTLRLQALPDYVKSLVHNTQLTAGHARALLNHVDPAAIADLVVSKGLNVRQTEALSAPRKESRGKLLNDTANHDVDALAVELSNLLGLQVDITRQRQRGHIRLRFDTLDQLDSIVVRLRHGS